jgi:bile acid-coenzyme A ligase
MSEPISYGARLRQLAAERPDRPAVTDAKRSITWRELDRRTNRLARGLLAVGVKHGDLVTLGLPNTVDFIEACYGLWKIGATPQPISHRLPAAEAEAVMNLADTPLLLAGDSIASARRRFEVDDLLALATDDGPLEDAVAPVWKAPTSGGSTAQADPVGRRRPLRTGRGWRLAHKQRRRDDHAWAALS